MLAGNALWEGEVTHARRSPKRHAFRQGLFMTAIDLAALDEAAAVLRPVLPFLPPAARFTRADHLGDPAEPLDRATRRLVHDRLDFEPRGSIVLLTHLRRFGYRFNPISFYFCLGAAEPGADAPLEAIVLEVNNTPWNEQHVYALDCRGRASPYEFEVPKAFHVSPFMGMAQSYRFRFDLDGDALRIVKTSREAGETIFSAQLQLTRLPFRRAVLARLHRRHPFMTGEVTLGIYWQALRLWLKGVPYVPHPADRKEAEHP